MEATIKTVFEPQSISSSSSFTFKIYLSSFLSSIEISPQRRPHRSQSSLKIKNESSRIKKLKSQNDGKITTNRGVRMRYWGSRVSEIRESGKEKRIWPGTFSTAEKVPRPHGVASLQIKGHLPFFNFSEIAHEFPRPVTSGSCKSCCF